MHLYLLQNPVFFSFLFQIDKNLAKEARHNGCPVCGGPLHWANYARSPRGGVQRCNEEHTVRFSLCCGREGCRKRLTPPSVRFLGRKVYTGAAVVLASAMSQGVTPTRAEKILKLFGVSRQTLLRWRKWWLKDFADSRFWKGNKGLLIVPLDPAEIPLSLLARFIGTLPDRLVAFLRFISPISSASAPENLAF